MAEKKKEEVSSQLLEEALSEAGEASALDTVPETYNPKEQEKEIEEAPNEPIEPQEEKADYGKSQKEYESIFETEEAPDKSNLRKKETEWSKALEEAEEESKQEQKEIKKYQEEFPEAKPYTKEEEEKMAESRAEWFKAPTKYELKTKEEEEKAKEKERLYGEIGKEKAKEEVEVESQPNIPGAKFLAKGMQSASKFQKSSIGKSVAWFAKKGDNTKKEKKEESDAVIKARISANKQIAIEKIKARAGGDKGAKMRRKLFGVTDHPGMRRQVSLRWIDNQQPRSSWFNVSSSVQRPAQKPVSGGWWSQHNYAPRVSPAPAQRNLPETNLAQVATIKAPKKSREERMRQYLERMRKEAEMEENRRLREGYSRGGIVPSTGLTKVHKGEYIIPKSVADKLIKKKPCWGWW